MGNKKYTAYQLFTARFIAVFIWFLITVVQWSNNPKSSPGITLPVIVRAVEAFSVLLVSEALVFLVTRSLSFFQRRSFTLFLLFFSMYFFAVAANVVSLFIRGLIGYAPPKIDGFFFIQSLHFYVPLFLVAAIHFLVKYRVDLATERENKLKAEALAEQAKWMMLRFQVNPHFLFNTLNSIRALIGHDDEKARRVVTEMSDYFRYSLSIEKKPLVPIKEELRAVDNFLEIQKIRYPGRIVVKRQVDDSTHNCLIPVFGIQTLVENASKYGLKTCEGKVEINIETLRDQEGLTIRVSNTGRLVRQSKEPGGDGTNTGIQNLKNRLQFMDEGYRFSLEEKEGFVVATIKMKACTENEKLENNHR